MFKSRTVFVVGAGSGCDYHMPTGAALATDIAARLDIRSKGLGREHTGDKAIVNALHLHVEDNGHKGQINPYLMDGAWLISNGVELSNSIDTFMDIHGINERVQVCGKLAIANAILNAERKSRLYNNPSDADEKHLKLSELRDTWLVRFFRILTSGVPTTHLPALFSNIAFVNFNYDRCLESFFRRAVAAVYKMTSDEAAQFVDGHLKIYHPYGTIAPLPTSTRVGTLPFGADLTLEARQLLGVSQGIRTYNEQVEDEDELRAIQEELAFAEAIVFLGFAFHPLNVELLTPQIPTNIKRIYGTAKGISKPDCEVVEKQLRDAFDAIQSEVYLRPDLDCTALLDQFSRSFTMG